LLLQAFSQSDARRSGFRPDNVLMFGVELPKFKYPKPEQQLQFFDALLERLRAVPGVKAAGATRRLHWAGTGACSSKAEGVTFKEGEKDRWC